MIDVLFMLCAVAPSWEFSIGIPLRVALYLGENELDKIRSADFISVRRQWGFVDEERDQNELTTQKSLPSCLSTFNSSGM